MVGVPEDDLLGRPCTEALGQGAGITTLELVEAALAGNDGVASDSEIHSSKGTVTPVAISATVLRDHLGQTIGCVCLFQDITRRKQVEALNQLKNDLTDMIVHDLRTPLTSLLTGMQTIELLGDLNADQQEFLGISIEGGHILLGMINDLLDISKIEDGSFKLECQEVEVSALLASALRQVTSLAEAKGLTLTLETEGETLIHADEDKLRRTLVNLLSNAIKFTPEKGCVSVSGRRVDGGDFIFSVCDTGEGIPEEAHERIFEKFGQVEKRSGGRKMSTGLGLTFCKMVAEAHGGSIRVESEMGKGSTFTFVIPAKSDGAPLMATPQKTFDASAVTSKQ